MKYFDELKRAMTWLGEQPDTFFLGQAVTYAGTAMTNTLTDIDKNKLLEMPVNEDMQMGISFGMSLNGRVPISIFPRWNIVNYSESIDAIILVIWLVHEELHHLVKDYY